MAKLRCSLLKPTSKEEHGKTACLESLNEEIHFMFGSPTSLLPSSAVLAALHPSSQPSHALASSVFFLLPPLSWPAGEE